MILPTLAFGLTAFIYSLAGFAGGSTYLALLIIFGVPFAVTPVIALICNILVSAFTGVRYVQAGLVRLRLLVPHMALAIPGAYLGGCLTITKWQFQWLAAGALLWASIYLIGRYKRYDETLSTRPPPLYVALPAGAVLGFISGVIGIGGGIFLAPFLYLLRAGTPKEIASTCCLFILVNSLAGLAGQLQKLGAHDLTGYWPLPLAVLIGSGIGSHLTLRVLPLRYITAATGVLLLAIALHMGWEIFHQQP